MADQRSLPINANWSIDTTSKSLITISTGILTAALSDNVQPLAVLACEAYGATLPMCQEICDKMERLARRKHISHVMQRVGATIGFAPGDIADQLASNTAGVRFLALGAAMLSLGSPFKAAQYIHYLLDESSPNKQLLPTIQQLKDLLGVLERKLACAGFVDSLEVWSMILQSQDDGKPSIFSEPEPVYDNESLDRPNDKDSNKARHSETEGPNYEIHQGLHGEESSGQKSNTFSPSAQPELTVLSGPSEVDFRTTQTNNSYIESRSVETKAKVKYDLDQTDVGGFSNSETVMDAFSLPRLGFSNLFTGIWKRPGPCEKRDCSVEFRPGKTQIPKCPPVLAVVSIIRALSEMERVGEATFTTIQTPPSTAVWVVTFIRWCLGVEPYIRVNEGRDLVLKQTRSKVLVDIRHSAGKDFFIRTYRNLGGIDKVLWESRRQLLHAKVGGWLGMMRIKTYFNTRLQNLQSLHRLYHIRESLLLLASKFTDRIRTTSPWPTKPFHSSPMLVMLVAKFFDIENPLEKLRSLNRSELEDTWSRLGIHRARLVAELFLDLLVSSLIENVHIENDPEVFVQVSSVRVHNIILPDLLEPVSKFLLGQLPISDTIFLQHSDAEDALLCLLGSRLLDLAGGLGLATSDRGQVAYLSVLESLIIQPQCMYKWRVFPGWLQHEGETYAYISGTGRSHVGDVLKFSEVSIRDYSSNRMHMKQISGTHDLWMHSVEDNHLLVYWVPNAELDSHLDIRLSMADAEHLMFLDECQSTCTPLSNFSSDLVYCKTLAAALHETQFKTFRVLCLHHSVHEDFFVQATIGREIRSRKVTGATKLLALVCSNACISCACNAATEFLEAHNNFSREQPKVVIIA